MQWAASAAMPDYSVRHGMSASWDRCGWIAENFAGMRVLSEGAVTAATADCTPGLNEARGLGWQVNRPVHVDGATDTVEPGSAGTQLSERAFGHTGFTGTSLWIDPDLNLVAVLLTNRVHPTVGDAATIRNLRSSFHDALVTSLRGSALDTLS